MNKIVEIDINSREDLFEQYDGKKVSKDLIDFLINNTPKFKKTDKVKVVIHNNMNNDIYCGELIKKALDLEITKSEYRFMYTNRRQVVLFVVGIIILALASIINVEILNELFIIGAWVLLWEMVELEINDDISNYKKKRILKKLVTSEFEEIKK